MPIGHTAQQAHVEIVLDGDGNFRRASVLARENTVLPATERSASRGYGEAPHALCDKIQYCAGDYAGFGGRKDAYFDAYLAQLQCWCDSENTHPKARAVLAYVSRRSVVRDLLDAGVLVAAGDVLLTDWVGEEPEPAIFKQLTPKKDGAASVRDQGDAFVRWRVEVPGDPLSAVWEDTELQTAWQCHYAQQQTTRGLCLVSGVNDTVLAEQHPAKLRHGGDKAKLISSNDTSGYTFRGRLIEADQAATVGFEVTQKAHNALRWLIERQAFRSGDQVVVAWAVAGEPIPDPWDDSQWIFLQTEVGTDSQAASVGDIGQSFAIRLRAAIRGYGARLSPDDDIVVLGLDSATPGRMAITLYRELKGSAFLARIERWHALIAWHQHLDKERRFTGAPALRDIAEAAYGPRLDDKLRKATVERLLSCVIDANAVPWNLVASSVRRASNRTGLEPWDWRRTLGIACGLFRGFFKERNYLMSLEPDRTSRDYLYGRLLAIADQLESTAQYFAHEPERDTNAARLMQRFSDRPCSTWRTLSQQLGPYKSRLRARNAAALYRYDKLLDEVHAAFTPADFTNDAPLSGEYLLGFHCQRQALRPPSKPAEEPTELTAATQE
jgi:CRISPR-associated protein Csd1